MDQNKENRTENSLAQMAKDHELGLMKERQRSSVKKNDDNSKTEPSKLANNFAQNLDFDITENLVNGEGKELNINDNSAIFNKLDAIELEKSAFDSAKQQVPKISLMGSPSPNPLASIFGGGAGGEGGSPLLALGSLAKCLVKLTNTQAYAQSRSSNLLGVSNSSVGGKVTEKTEGLKGNIVHMLRANTYVPETKQPKIEESVLVIPEAIVEPEEELIPKKKDLQFFNESNINKRRYDLAIDIKKSMGRLFKDLRRPPIMFAPGAESYSNKKNRAQRLEKIPTNKPDIQTSIVSEMIKVENYRSDGKCSKAHHNKENS